MTAIAETAKGAPVAGAPPADGQLVTIRNRVWVVSQVTPGTLAGGDGTTLTGRVPHVVTLVSIEDDARDEQPRAWCHFARPRCGPAYVRHFRFLMKQGAGPLEPLKA